MARLIDGVSYLGRHTLAIVLPSPCIVCGGDLPWTARRASCCASCWTSLPRLAAVHCRRCAAPWHEGPEDFRDYVCLACAPLEDDPVAWIAAWGEYRGGLERLLHAFKFERHDFLDAPLASLLVERWRALEEGAFDAVVPIPIHPRRLAARGYNQAELLARSFCAATGLPLRSGALRKRLDTPAQSTLHREERAANVRRAFASSPSAAGRSVLLVDDVCTTGATLRAAAAALRGAGTTRVAALVVARA
ncbi:MAG: ComF family protein [Thermoanaerobaculia bacterium]